MSIRFSTNQYFSVNINQMMNQQNKLGKIQAQMATGQSVLKPSDDPLAMAVALGAKAGVKSYESFQSNLSYVNNQLNQMDVALGSASDVMISIKETMVSARNGTLSPSDRETMAQDIEGRLEELRGIANRQGPNGDYLFAGTFQDQTPFQKPDALNGITGSFLETATPAAAAAITGRSIQVSKGSSIDLSLTANDAFVNKTTGDDVFTILRDTVALLRNPGYPSGQEGATPADTYLVAFNAKAAQLDEVFNNSLITRTKVGVRLREAETIEQINLSAQNELERVAGEAVGLDYAKAISELSQGQLQLQAAQQSFAKVSQLSLFNFLS